MTAVDTNVIVRLLTQDDRKQAGYAGSLFAAEQVWISKSVLLETSWVLESVYRFSAASVREALTKLLGLPNVGVEDETAVARALALAGKGIELADALHLTSKPEGARFVSFDQTFVRRARKAGAVETVVLDSRTVREM